MASSRDLRTESRLGARAGCRADAGGVIPAESTTDATTLIASANARRLVGRKFVFTLNSVNFRRRCPYQRGVRTVRNVFSGAVTGRNVKREAPNMAPRASESQTDSNCTVLFVTHRRPPTADNSPLLVRVQHFLAIHPRLPVGNPLRRGLALQVMRKPLQDAPLVVDGVFLLGE